MKIELTREEVEEAVTMYITQKILREPYLYDVEDIGRGSNGAEATVRKRDTADMVPCPVAPSMPPMPASR